jgi:hypothetical protein
LTSSNTRLFLSLLAETAGLAVLVAWQTDVSIAFQYGSSHMDFEGSRSDAASTDGAHPREGDYAIIPSGRRFKRAVFSVVQTPATPPVDHGADLPREVAEAYALDLAEQRGALAWDLTGTLPRKLVASPDTWPANEQELARKLHAEVDGLSVRSD